METFRKFQKNYVDANRKRIKKREILKKAQQFYVQQHKRLWVYVHYIYIQHSGKGDCEL